MCRKIVEEGGVKCTVCSVNFHKSCVLFDEGKKEYYRDCNNASLKTRESNKSNTPFRCFNC